MAIIAVVAFVILRAPAEEVDKEPVEVEEERSFWRRIQDWLGF